MKSAKTILIVAAVLFAALSLRPVSAEREPQPTEPARVVRTPARPPSASEEEAPIPKPPTPIPNQAARPVRVTSPRTPGQTTPTRIPTRAAPRTPRRPVRPAQDPHKDTVIFVEAFMVEVKLLALHSQGVPEISEVCKSVSAEQIIKLMKTTDAAVVTAGAKVVVVHSNKAETKSSTQRHVFIGPSDKKVVRREYVEVGTTFSTFAIIRSGQKIYMDIGFEHSGVEEGDGKTDSAVLVEREWTSSITLQDGKPTLIGAVQEKEDAVFLIVTAHIKD